MVVKQLRLKPLPSLLQDILACVEPAVLFWEIFLFVLDIKYLKLPFWCVYVLAGERKSCLNGFFFPLCFPLLCLPSSTAWISNSTKRSVFFCSWSSFSWWLWAVSYPRWNLHLMQISEAFLRSPPTLQTCVALYHHSFCVPAAWHRDALVLGLGSFLFPLPCALSYHSCHGWALSVHSNSFAMINGGRQTVSLIENGMFFFFSSSEYLIEN